MPKKHIVPIVNIAIQFEEARTKILKGWEKVLTEGIFISGKEKSNFEKAFAKFVGTNFAVTVASGTDALRLSLIASGLREKDEVITPSFTFAASAIAIIQAGAKPVFVDIDPQIYTIDCSKIEGAITKNTKAILPVHLFGQVADMPRITKIANKYKLKVIEDACQAHGAKFKDKNVGTLGNLAAFSFYPTKNLGSFSDAGAITTNNKSYEKRIRRLSNYGFKLKYISEEIGFNSRIDELQAVWLKTFLKFLPKWNRKRQVLARRYLKLLKTLPIQLPQTLQRTQHAYHIFAIRTPKRDKLKRFLENKGVSTLIHYPVPLHLQPAFKEYKTGRLINSEKVAKEILSLPIYPQMTIRQQNYVVETIRDFFKRKA